MIIVIIIIIIFFFSLYYIIYKYLKIKCEKIVVCI
jgi:hypothetical protein